MFAAAQLTAVGVSVALAMTGLPSLTAAAQLEVHPEVVTSTVDGLPSTTDGADDPVESHGDLGHTGHEPQHDRDHEDEPHAGAEIVTSPPVEMPMAFSLVGFSVPDDAALSVRHRKASDSWSDWEAVHVNSDESPNPGSGEPAPVDDRGRVASVPLWTGPADQLQLRVRGATPEDVAVHLVDGLGQNRGLGERLSDAADAAARALHLPEPATATTVDRPEIATRAEWGAQPSGGPSYADSVRGAVVHHTVTSNSYSPSQAPAVVRSIQAYHQDHLGWKDIGYNFLVDRFGQVYQGRAGGTTEPVIGAHAAGHNTGTVGVAFLGQHQAGASPPFRPVSDAAGEAAVDLLAWLFDVHGIDARGEATLPSGYTYPSWARQIVGHASLGQTTCPGSSVNETLPTLRDGVLAAQQAPTDRRGAGGDRNEAGAAALTRLAGPSRYATAAQVSHHVRERADEVVVASSSAYPDALAAAGLAGARDAPVLLADHTGLGPDTAAEIDRLGATRAVLVGGEAVLGPQVEGDLAARGLDVERIAGDDRFATAARIAAHLGDAGGAVLANGVDGWPDAVAASQLAAAGQMPVLLTEPDHLPEPTRRALAAADADEILVVGGPSVIAEAVADELDHERTVTRLAGPDRVDTAVEVADHAADAGADSRQVWLASAADWPDALTAGPAAARAGQVLMLTWPGSLSADGPVARRVGRADHVWLLGGPAAISSQVERRLTQVLAP